MAEHDDGVGRAAAGGRVAQRHAQVLAIRGEIHRDHPLQERVPHLPVRAARRLENQDAAGAAGKVGLLAVAQDDLLDRVAVEVDLEAGREAKTPLDGLEPERRFVDVREARRVIGVLGDYKALVVTRTRPRDGLN